MSSVDTQVNDLADKLLATISDNIGENPAEISVIASLSVTVRLALVLSRTSEDARLGLEEAMADLFFQASETQGEC